MIECPLALAVRFEDTNRTGARWCRLHRSSVGGEALLGLLATRWKVARIPAAGNVITHRGPTVFYSGGHLAPLAVLVRHDALVWMLQFAIHDVCIVDVDLWGFHAFKIAVPVMVMMAMEQVTREFLKRHSVLLGPILCVRTKPDSRR